MGLLDKVEKEAKEKKKSNVTYVQVKVPTDVHTEVSRILSERNINWQKLLMGAIHMILEESKRKDYRK